jgi:hypothetical protein
MVTGPRVGQGKTSIAKLNQGTHLLHMSSTHACDYEGERKVWLGSLSDSSGPVGRGVAAEAHLTRGAHPRARHADSLSTCPWGAPSTYSFTMGA